MPIIHPENKRKQYWDFLVLLLTIYSAVEVPLRLVVKYPLEGWVYYFDWFITACFFTDIFLNFNTALVGQGGQYIRDRRKIASLYLRGWFVIDLLAAIPFDLLLSGAIIGVTETTRALRLMRLFRLARIAQFMKTSVKKAMINLSVLRMLFLAFWILMVSHWVACGWMALGGGNIAADTSVFDAQGNILDPWRFYLRSLYYSITTIATIGYGDITPQTNWQTIYSMMVEIFGAAMYGYVIGTVASLLANIDVARAQYLEKMERLNTFMKFRKIPDELQDHIRNYYDYLWESRRGYDESQVLDDLPSALKTQVSLHLNKEIIQKVPLFQSADDNLIRQLVQNLRPVVFTPGDYIFRKGEVGDEMFFISRGRVEVVSEDGLTVFATLREGNFFGEIALLLRQPRTASIRAIDFCDLYTLDQNTFQRIIYNYPDFTKYVEEFARQRLSEVGGRISTESPDQAPPGRVEGFTGERSADGVVLHWTPVKYAVVYELARRDADSGHWRRLRSSLTRTTYNDTTSSAEAMYRVRAGNDAGEGPWSDMIIR